MIKLSKFEGKMVKLLDNNGHRYEGLVGDYIYPEDNEPEGVEGIILDYPMVDGKTKSTELLEFTVDDIRSIELI